MKIVRGDLLEMALNGHFDAIVHGCNCQCAMGAGIALAIKRTFPEAYQVDLQTAKGDPAKLGTISCARVVRGAFSFHVINAYTQLHWRGRGVKADYGAIRRAMRLVREQYAGRRIGYPRIGAGLAEGDWSTIATIIDEELRGEDHTLVELPRA